MRKATRNKLKATRVVTRILHIPHDPDTSRRLWEACRAQALAYNETIAWLHNHPETPVETNRRIGKVALHDRWAIARKAKPGLTAISQQVWRGGVARGHTAAIAWEKINTTHARQVLRAMKTGTPVPRRVERRNPEWRRLLRSRKRMDRRGRNTCTLGERVRRIDLHTIRLPGLETVSVTEHLGKHFKPVSATVVERTPGAVLRTRPAPEERCFNLHVQIRVPRPDPKTGGTSVGIDHGIANAITISDSDGMTAHYHHADTAGLETRRRKLQRRARHCRRGSRRWRRHRRHAAALARRVAGIHSASRERWAGDIAGRYDTVAVEAPNLRNMLRSARGSSEAPGTRVSQKQGLNRGLARIAPGKQTDALRAACERTGARFVKVPAKNTSIRCAACGHVDRDSRESQARFRCTVCGHTAHADVNAAENVRQAGMGTTGAGVSRSRVAATPRKAPRSAPQRRATPGEERETAMNRREAGAEARLRKHTAAGVVSRIKPVPSEAAPRPATAGEMETDVSQIA